MYVRSRTGLQFLQWKLAHCIPDGLCSNAKPLVSMMESMDSAQEQEHPEAPPAEHGESIMTVDADKMDEESLEEVMGLLSHLEASLRTPLDILHAYFRLL